MKVLHKIHREFRVVWECVRNFYVEHTDAVNCELYMSRRRRKKKINKDKKECLITPRHPAQHIQLW